jgi:hypothetical protein
MIPVVKQPEPLKFNEHVRIPGSTFLITNPSPNSKQFHQHNYWRDIKADLYQLYKSVCAYTGEWFPEPAASVDHFIPTSKEPRLAYEWDNYRLTTQKMNNIKGNKTDLIDPFEVQLGWFVLDFPSCYIKSCMEITDIEDKKVRDTINALELNSYERTDTRYNIIQEYINGKMNFDFLRINYPYIAYEIERQNLIEDISNIFKTLI